MNATLTTQARTLRLSGLLGSLEVRLQEAAGNQLSHAEFLERLFEIIMRRYENRSTIMTSNRPIEEWGKLLGDVPSATAILDRFLHHAEIIAIEGQSYRLADRQQAKQQQPQPTSKPAK